MGVGSGVNVGVDSGVGSGVAGVAGVADIGSDVGLDIGSDVGMGGVGGMGGVSMESNVVKATFSASVRDAQTFRRSPGPLEQASRRMTWISLAN